MGTDIVPWLKRVPIFHQLSDEALDDIAKITDISTYNAETSIFKKNDAADALYIIISGQVRIEEQYRDGRKKTLAYLASGHFFGEMAIITSKQRCAGATAAETSTLLCIEQNLFLEALKKNAELCFGILKVVCERLENADVEIGNLTFRNLPGRIVSKLFELADQFGEPHPKGTMVTLELTHYDLADMVGTNRESISKYLAKFKKEGSLATQKKHFIIVNRRKLKAWSWGIFFISSFGYFYLNFLVIIPPSFIYGSLCRFTLHGW